MPRDSFGLRLTQIRRAMKLTQGEIAALCDLDDGSWSNWERGGRPRNMAEVVQQIHGATNVDRDWLMWGAEGAMRCPSCGQPEGQHPRGGSPTGAQSRCSLETGTSGRHLSIVPDIRHGWSTMGDEVFEQAHLFDFAT